MNNSEEFHVDPKMVDAIDVIAMHHGQTRANTTDIILRFGISAMALADPSLTHAVAEVLGV
ncbi:hypothetical protein ACIREO_02865 [Streptomyces sp. NPDC102441]|uniref:hypothetical protein n=1 Tax=Streptomyces sp. NPDC102441 TaxID=3366176 RepID=UPI003830A383